MLLSKQQTQAEFFQTPSGFVLVEDLGGEWRVLCFQSTESSKDSWGNFKLHKVLTLHTEDLVRRTLEAEGAFEHNYSVMSDETIAELCEADIAEKGGDIDEIRACDRFVERQDLPDNGDEI